MIVHRSGTPGDHPCGPMCKRTEGIHRDTVFTTHEVSQQEAEEVNLGAVLNLRGIGMCTVIAIQPASEAPPRDDVFRYVWLLTYRELAYITDPEASDLASRILGLKDRT